MTTPLKTEHTERRISSLREGGRFAIETHSVAIESRSGFITWWGDMVVVYADKNQPSHCVWMVPQTHQ